MTSVINKFRRLAGLTLVVSLSFMTTGSHAGAQQSESQDVSARLAGSFLVAGHSLDYVKGLADGFGGRLTGSDAYNRAAEWAAEQFRAAGIKNVKLEPFRIEHGWERGWGHGRIVSPLARLLHVESLGWTPSTPPGGVKGEIIRVDDISSSAVKAQADKIRNRIVNLNTEAIFASGPDALGELLTCFPLLKSAGAAAVIIADREPNNVLNAFSPGFGTGIAPLPIAQIGMEDDKLINRLMEKGPVTIEFQYENHITGPKEVNNVVAEIPGREKPDEWIIVGAHLDSWDYGTGAQDNGAGTAQVLEVARALAALDRAPRRSVRFGLWGGEEEGILGSLAYVNAHSGELDKCIAVLNTDNGAGHPKGWKVEGRPDVAAAIKPLASVLSGLEAAGISQDTTFDTDHGPFMLHGIPSLDLWVDMAHYGEVHHKSSDTVDKIDAHNLANGAAVVAVTAYIVADKADPLAPHIDHAAVGEILKKAHLDGFLKAVGVWKN
jgi:carboxypeptidase Q